MNKSEKLKDIVMDKQFLEGDIYIQESYIKKSMDKMESLVDVIKDAEKEIERLRNKIRTLDHDIWNIANKY